MPAASNLTSPSGGRRSPETPDGTMLEPSSFKVQQVSVVSTVDFEGLLDVLQVMKKGWRDLKNRVAELADKNANLEAQLASLASQKPTPVPVPVPIEPAPAPPPPQSVVQNVQNTTQVIEKADTSALEARVAALERAVDQAAQEASAANTRADDANTRADDALTRANAAQTTLDALARDVEDLRGLVSGLLDKQKDTLNDPNASADERLDAMSALLAELRALVESAARDAKESLAKANNLETVTGELSQDAAELKSTTSTMNDRLANTESEIRTTIPSLRSDCKMAADVAKSTAKDHAEFKAEQEANVDMMKQSIGDLASRVEALEQDMKEAVKLPQFDESTAKLQEQISDLAKLLNALANREPTVVVQPKEQESPPISPIAPTKVFADKVPYDDSHITKDLSSLAKRMEAAERELHDHLERIRRGDATDMDLDKRIATLEMLDIRAKLRDMDNRMTALENSDRPSQPAPIHAPKPIAAADIDHEHDDLNKRIAALESQLEALQAVRASLSDVQSRLARAESELQDVGSELGATRGDMSKLRKRLEKLLARVEALEGRLHLDETSLSNLHAESSMLTGRCLSCDRPLPDGVRTEVAPWVPRQRMPRGFVRVDDPDKVDMYGERADVRDPPPSYVDTYDAPRAISPPSHRKSAALLPGVNPVRSSLDSAELIRHAGTSTSTSSLGTSPRGDSALFGATAPPSKVHSSTPTHWFANSSTPDVHLNRTAGPSEYGRPNTSDPAMSPRRKPPISVDESDIEAARARLKSAGQASPRVDKGASGGSFAPYNYTPYSRSQKRAYGVPGHGYVTHRGVLAVNNPYTSALAASQSVPGGLSNSPSAGLVSPRVPDSRASPRGGAQHVTTKYHSTYGGGRRDPGSVTPRNAPSQTRNIE
ncbi:hypothetical protein RI054_04g23340 [Pseudoscourfieldia marina]